LKLLFPYFYLVANIIRYIIKSKSKKKAKIIKTTKTKYNIG